MRGASSSVRILGSGGAGAVGSTAVVGATGFPSVPVPHAAASGSAAKVTGPWTSKPSPTWYAPASKESGQSASSAALNAGLPRDAIRSALRGHPPTFTRAARNVRSP